MSLNDSLAIVVNAVEVLVAESMNSRCCLRIVHRLRQAGVVNCMAGEEVFAAFVIYRGREYQLHLSLSGRLLLDYLARHRHCAQSAGQIAIGIQTSDFYRKHAINAGRNPGMRRRIARSAVKVYVQRLRHAFAATFQEAGLAIDPNEVILSKPTVTNEVGYKLHAMVEWLHT